MNIIKKKSYLDIEKVIEKEMAMARRSNYLFGVVVISFHEKKDAGKVKEIIEERIRAYDIYEKTSSQSYVVVLRNINNDEVKTVAQFFELKIENGNIEYFVYPVSQDKMKSVIECGYVMEKKINIKRAVDVVLSTFFCIFLAPVVCIIAFCIKVSSPGPVFFRQERVGFLGKKFIIYKFRTMHAGVDEYEHVLYLKKIIKESKNRLDICTNMKKMEDSNRIFPFGRFIRKYCLDEIPQFLNVIKGDMSIVGPRPPIQYEVEEYKEWYKERFDVYPGLTGLWQVSGKNKLNFEKMIKLDIEYKKKCSFVGDLKIMCMTPVVILKQYM